MNAQDHAFFRHALKDRVKRLKIRDTRIGMGCCPGRVELEGKYMRAQCRTVDLLARGVVRKVERHKGPETLGLLLGEVLGLLA